MQYDDFFWEVHIFEAPIHFFKSDKIQRNYRRRSQIQPIDHFYSPECGMTIQTHLEENAETKQNKASNKDIVMKVYMHCDGCANKVVRCLKVMEGVEDVVIDRDNNKVVVKGSKACPLKVLERVQAKYSRNAELISPKPNPEKKGKEKKEEKDDPPLRTIVLKMFMHCEGCAQEIKTMLVRMSGILSAEPDMKTSLVTVKGTVDAMTLAGEITKRMGKHVEIINQNVEKNKKEEKDKNGKAKGNNGKKTQENVCVVDYPPQHYHCVPHINPCQVFSDENVNSCSIM